MNATEIWPERVRNVNLGVRALPQEKIRNAQFATGAHQKIEFRQVADDPSGRPSLERLALLERLMKAPRRGTDRPRAGVDDRNRGQASAAIAAPPVQACGRVGTHRFGHELKKFHRLITSTVT